MPDTITTETVTVEREALLELLADAIATADVLDDLSPFPVEDFTSSINHKINDVVSPLGESARFEIEREGERRARAFLASFKEDLQARVAAAPLSIQVLARALVEREAVLREARAFLVEEVGDDAS